MQNWRGKPRENQIVLECAGCGADYLREEFCGCAKLCGHVYADVALADDGRDGGGERRARRGDSTALVWFDRARVAIEHAASIDEVKTIRDQAEAMRLYCKQQREGLQMQNHCAEIKIRAERRAGELLREMPKNPGGKSTASTLEEVGIGHTQSHRWQTLAKLPAETFEAQLMCAKADEGELTSAAMYQAAKTYLDPAHVSHNSGEQEWGTPPEYLDAARKVLGTIDLDPASTPRANALVQATRFFTPEQDGLAWPWTGTVWMNPPYSADLVGKFVRKLCGHITAGDVPAAIILVNNATDTLWFRELSTVCQAVCFPYGRIRFLSPHGEQGSPLQGQAVCYSGPEVARFGEVFGRLGSLWTPWEHADRSSGGVTEGEDHA